MPSLISIWHPSDAQPVTNDVQLRPELAAGGLLYRSGASGTEILLVHRPKYDDWAFPKGRLDPGESLLQCAIREVGEETGIIARVGRKLPQVVYTKPSGKRKKVAFWAMTSIAGSFSPNHEIDEVKWVPVAKAPKRLTYKADKRFITELSKKWTAPPRRILLVRHAHAGDRHRWSGDDDALRPLTAKGHRQAYDLSIALAHFDIDRVASSPAARCIETVADLASARGMEVVADQDLWEDTPVELAQDMVVNARRGTTLLCTHGPIVAGLLRSLLGTRRAIPHEKGSAWILDVRKRTVFDANYLGPTAANG